jgi:hypothetical protein
MRYEIERNRAFETRIIAGCYLDVISQFSIIKFFALAKKIGTNHLRGTSPSNHKPHSMHEKSGMGSCTLIPAYGAYGRNTISVMRRFLFPKH